MATILIIEDTPANMKLATVILEAAGHAVLQAGTAPEGIALARDLKPDLILMDVQLPGMNGLEAARLLKSDAATSEIPIIAMTAFAMKGDKEKMLAAGCDGYLAKPFRHREFIAAVADGLVKRSADTQGDEHD